MSNQSHLALVAQVSQRPEDTEETRVASQDQVRPQPPTHLEALMSIRDLLGEADARHAELDAQYRRTCELLDELVLVAYEEYMEGGRAYPRQDPPGYESTKVSRWLEDHRSLLPEGVPFPRRWEEFNRVSGLPANQQRRSRLLGALALSVTVWAIVQLGRRSAGK